MTKPKSPLLSLGARGTIGDTLTYQKRATDHIVRQKPVPTDPYSLNQAYQRWDYRDYAYLWTLLSNSQKQVYRTKASRYHITGFSQWMRENLKDLSNLAGRWHLDEKAGATAYDSSRNTNNGIIFGASPATGPLAGAYDIDGINDYINAGHDPSLDITGELTIEAWINPDDSGQLGFGRILEKFTAFGIFMNGVGVQDLNAYIMVGGAFKNVGSAGGAVSYGNWHLVHFIFDLTNIRLYVDLTEFIGAATPGPIDIFPAADVLIGNRWDLVRTFNGRLDEVRLYTRALDATERQRHFERRYPA